MTNAEARFNKSLRPRKPKGSLGRTAQDVHLDSHTAPELWTRRAQRTIFNTLDNRGHKSPTQSKRTGKKRLKGHSPKHAQYTQLHKKYQTEIKQVRERERRGGENEYFTSIFKCNFTSSARPRGTNSTDTTHADLFQIHQNSNVRKSCTGYQFINLGRRSNNKKQTNHQQQKQQQQQHTHTHTKGGGGGGEEEKKA